MCDGFWVLAGPVRRARRGDLPCRAYVSLRLQPSCSHLGGRPQEEEDQEGLSLFAIQSQMRIRPTRIRRNTDPFKPQVVVKVLVVCSRVNRGGSAQQQQQQQGGGGGGGGGGCLYS